MISLLLIERAKLREAAHDVHEIAAGTADPVQKTRLAEYASALERRADTLSEAAEKALEDWYGSHSSGAFGARTWTPTAKSRTA